MHLCLPWLFSYEKGKILHDVKTCVCLLQAWLIRRNNIQYGENFLKAELLALVKQYKSDPRYRIDQVTREAGHTVLRLPPYPIELIWSQLKRYVAANNVTFKLPDVQQLAEGAFKTITAERWRSVCEHVKKIETDYWTRDNLCESEIEKFVINLEEDSSSEED